MPERSAVQIVGVVGGEVFGVAAREALSRADVVVGSARQRSGVVTNLPTTIDTAGPLDAVYQQIAAAHDEGRRVCVLASGDPGFFGLVRSLVAQLGSGRPTVVHPAPSSVALAFGRLSISWDDAIVVSAHGRPIQAAVDAAQRHDKVAVLTSPDNPPQRLGELLVASRAPARRVVVVSRLGEADESFTDTTVDGLATGSFDPMSVVILVAVDRAGAPAPGAMGVRWGRDESAYSHRNGMITKSEVRAVVLAKLALPSHGVLWDVGTGSGSVAIEAAALASGLDVFAIDRDADAIERVTANAHTHAVDVRTVLGAVPAALADLPDPDVAFVGGGGIDALDAVLGRLRPGGRVVATFVLLDRALAAYERLGSMCQLTVSRARPLGDGVMLAPENPVFVCWGAP
jgi:precorrin-6Y C5,15-methyltransferase (decarboxylating)